jgi:hypothetical protein
MKQLYPIPLIADQMILGKQRATKGFWILDFGFRVVRRGALQLQEAYKLLFNSRFIRPELWGDLTVGAPLPANPKSRI